jgi:hypothetical protein
MRRVSTCRQTHLQACTHIRKHAQASTHANMFLKLIPITEIFFTTKDFFHWLEIILYPILIYRPIFYNKTWKKIMPNTNRTWYGQKCESRWIIDGSVKWLKINALCKLYSFSSLFAILAEWKSARNEIKSRSWTLSAFLNPNHSATRFFTTTYNFSGRGTKAAPFWSTIRPALPSSFQYKGTYSNLKSQIYVNVIFLWLNTKIFGSIMQTLLFFGQKFHDPLEIFHDPLEVFHDPLQGRDRSVEKHWTM